MRKCDFNMKWAISFCNHISVQIWVQSNISDYEFLLKSRAKIYQASLFLLIIIIMKYIIHNNYYKKEK